MWQLEYGIRCCPWDLPQETENLSGLGIPLGFINLILVGGRLRDRAWGHKKCQRTVTLRNMKNCFVSLPLKNKDLNIDNKDLNMSETASVLEYKRSNQIKSNLFFTLNTTMI